MYDHIIVGSGAGGATVARELSRSGKRVLVVEAGPQLKAKRANSTYSIVPSAVEIWSTACLGGTTMVTMGNAVRSSCRELERFYGEAEEEMGVSQTPDSHIGKAGKTLLEVSDAWHRMPKAIDFSKCRMCGHCSLGCPNRAKWDATRYLEDAESHGAKVRTSCGIRKLMVRSGAVHGVETWDGVRLESGSIVLCAGGLETPRILMRSGMEGVGDGLYVDTFVTVGGVKKDIGLNRGLGMSIFMRRKGYLLSPHYSNFLIPYLTSRGIEANPSDLLSLMVKIEDEPSGKVFLDSVFKTVTEKDKQLIDRGRKEAEEILIRAGVDGKTIVSTYYRGTHPGGTCSGAMDKSYGMEINGLHIADASIIPGPFGQPPMLTIIALAKKISRTILEKG